MRIDRRFYNSTLNLKNIKLERVVLGIVLGLASAFTIYSFFYVLRESFRVMSFGFANLPYVLSENDRNKYNIFFAGLSVIFANSITVNLLLSKPAIALSRKNPIRRRILNDQIFLSFNFIYWFTKMGLCFLVFSMCCMDFDFSPYVGYVSTLLLIVLYLDSWKGLSSIFRKNRLKFQLLHVVILIFLTLGLSKINVLDYKSIDDLAIKSSPVYQLPHSNFYNEKNHRNYNGITFKVELDAKSDIVILTRHKWASLKDIPNIIVAERASIREELIPFFAVRISTNKDIDLVHIKMIESELYRVNQRKIIYDVYNDDLLTSRFETRGINYRIVKPIYDVEINNKYDISLFPLPFNLTEYSFKDTLNISINELFKVNGITVSKNELIKELKNHINPETIFIYNFSSKTKYQDYITVLSSHHKAANELRKNEQTIFHEYDYQHDEFCRQEKRKLMEKYPIIILEKLID